MTLSMRAKPTGPGPGQLINVDVLGQAQGLGVGVGQGEPALPEQRSPDPGMWFVTRRGVSDRSS